jgi:hypothetical protein
MNKEFSDKMAASGYKVLMIITGGGMTAATESTKHGGASRWFHGASLPYAYEMSDLYTNGNKPVVGESTARLMSVLASDFHGLLDLEDVPWISASCTAALVSEGERVGREHRAYIDINRNHEHFAYKLSLEPLDRDWQEQILAQVFCNLILHHTASDEAMQYPGLELLQ